VPSREELNRFNARAQALGEAAATGDLKQVTAMLAEEPALVTHRRPFSDACKAGQPAAVRALIQAGADVNTTEGSGPTGSQKPLLWTLRPIDWTTGHRLVLELLLEHGANPSGSSADNVVTPLLAAAEWGHPEAVALLIASGAQIGFYEAVAIADQARVEDYLASSPRLAGALRPCGVGHGSSPGTSLHFAALSRLGNADPAVAQRLAAIAETLIRYGAPPQVATIEGELVPGPIASAGRSENVAVARVLLAHAADPQDALQPALHNSALAILALLADYPLNLDLPGDPKLGNTLLAELIRYGKLRSAEWLLARGATGGSGGSSEGGSAAARGATVAGADHNGWTALHYACHRGVNPEFVQQLLNRGADPNALDATGATPLALARQRGHARLVELLEANDVAP